MAITFKAGLDPVTSVRNNLHLFPIVKSNLQQQPNATEREALKRAAREKAPDEIAAYNDAYEKMIVNYYELAAKYHPQIREAHRKELELKVKLGRPIEQKVDGGLIRMDYLEGFAQNLDKARARINFAPVGTLPFLNPTPDGRNASIKLHDKPIVPDNEVEKYTALEQNTGAARERLLVKFEGFFCGKFTCSAVAAPKTMEEKVKYNRLVEAGKFDKEYGAFFVIMNLFKEIREEAHESSKKITDKIKVK
jgi:hypothetical protein